MDFIATTFQTLPAFLIYVAVCVGLLTAFAALYLWITPYAELALIRRGNVAAAVNFVATLLGFTLPLASLVSHAVNIVDVALWAVMAAIVQILAHVVARVLIADMPRQIESGNAAVATLAAGISVCFGILNAACLVY